MDAKHLGAEPASYVPDVIDHERNFYSFGGTGLTKRELFAAMAMQGMAADPNMDSGERTAELSVKWADFLLVELAKDQP